MSKTPQEDYREKVDLLAFFGAVKGSVNEINNKVIEGNNVRVGNVDVKKLAIEHDKSTGVVAQPVTHTVTIPATIPAAQQPQVTLQPQQDQLDPDQLLLPFDKKYNLNDVFAKIDDVYRAILKLETEVHNLKEVVEDKKKEL